MNLPLFSQWRRRSRPSANIIREVSGSFRSQIPGVDTILGPEMPPASAGQFLPATPGFRRKHSSPQAIPPSQGTSSQRQLSRQEPSHHHRNELARSVSTHRKLADCCPLQSRESKPGGVLKVNEGRPQHRGSPPNRQNRSGYNTPLGRESSTTKKSSPRRHPATHSVHYHPSPARRRTLHPCLYGRGNEVSALQDCTAAQAAVSVPRGASSACLGQRKDVSWEPNPRLHRAPSGTSATGSRTAAL